MSYLRKRAVQVPYNRGVFIQRGGGLFSSISDFAVRYARPWFQRALKTASSSMSKAAKSKTARNIVKHAKHAVQEGIHDAGKQILQGENIGEVLRSTASTAKKRIQQNLKDEAGKAIDSMHPNAKVPRLTPKKRVTKGKRQKRVLSGRSTKYRSIL